MIQNIIHVCRLLDINGIACMSKDLNVWPNNSNIHQNYSYIAPTYYLISFLVTYPLLEKGIYSENIISSLKTLLEVPYKLVELTELWIGTAGCRTVAYNIILKLTRLWSLLTPIDLSSS